MEGMQGTVSCYSNGVSLENDNHQIKNCNLQNEDLRPNRVSIDNSTSTFHTFMPPQPLKRDSFINMEGMQGTASCYSNGVSLENDNHQIKNSNLQNHQQYQSHVQGNNDSEGDDKIKPLPFGATGVEYEDSRANRVSIDNSTSTFHTFMPPQPLKRDSFINMEGMQGTVSCYSNGVLLENDN